MTHGEAGRASRIKLDENLTYAWVFPLHRFAPNSDQIRPNIMINHVKTPFGRITTETSRAVGDDGFQFYQVDLPPKGLYDVGVFRGFDKGEVSEKTIFQALSMLCSRVVIPKSCAPKVRCSGKIERLHVKSGFLGIHEDMYMFLFERRHASSIHEEQRRIMKHIRTLAHSGHTDEIRKLSSMSDDELVAWAIRKKYVQPDQHHGPFIRHTLRVATVMGKRFGYPEAKTAKHHARKHSAKGTKGENAKMRESKQGTKKGRSEPRDSAVTETPHAAEKDTHSPASPDTHKDTDPAEDQADPRSPTAKDKGSGGGGSGGPSTKKSAAKSAGGRTASGQTRDKTQAGEIPDMQSDPGSYTDSPAEVDVKTLQTEGDSEDSEDDPSPQDAGGVFAADATEIPTAEVEPSKSKSSSKESTASKVAKKIEKTTKAVAKEVKQELKKAEKAEKKLAGAAKKEAKKIEAAAGKLFSSKLPPAERVNDVFGSAFKDDNKS